MITVVALKALSKLLAHSWEVTGEVESTVWFHMCFTNRTPHLKNGSHPDLLVYIFNWGGSNLHLRKFSDELCWKVILRKHSSMLFRVESFVMYFIHLNFVGIDPMGLKEVGVYLITAYSDCELKICIKKLCTFLHRSKIWKQIYLLFNF